MNTIKYYRRLKYVNRMSTHPMLRNYNLLEHQYMVLVLFKYFAEKENIPYDLQVLDLVMNHDLLETVTSDLPYPVKNLNKKTQASWNVIEQEIIVANPVLSKYSDAYMKAKLTPIQFSLFKVCDLLDLWIFLMEEEGLGNHSTAVQEVIETCERLVLRKFNNVDKFINLYTF